MLTCKGWFVMIEKFRNKRKQARTSNKIYSFESSWSRVFRGRRI